MRRASYRDAVQWIADNDSAGEDDALYPSVVSGLVSAVLVADLFDVPSDKVGLDVVRARLEPKVREWCAARGIEVTAKSRRRALAELLPNADPDSEVSSDAEGAD